MNHTVCVCVCAVLPGLFEVLSRGALKPDAHQNYGPDRAGAGVCSVLAGGQKLPTNLREENSECHSPAIR